LWRPLADQLDEMVSLDDERKPYLASTGVYIFKRSGYKIKAGRAGATNTHPTLPITTELAAARVLSKFSLSPMLRAIGKNRARFLFVVQTIRTFPTE